MATYKYIEIKPKKHSKIFKTKRELYIYWEKRFKEYSNFDYINNPNINPKDFFDYKILTLNKDGEPRKKNKPLTKEQYQHLVERNKEYTQRRKKKTAELNKLKKEIEKELQFNLKEKGFDGQINIKFFKGERKHNLRDPKRDLFDISNGNLAVLQTIPEMMKNKKYRTELRKLALDFLQEKILQEHAQGGFI